MLTINYTVYFISIDIYCNYSIVGDMCGWFGIVIMEVWFKEFCNCELGCKNCNSWLVVDHIERDVRIGVSFGRIACHCNGVMK